jgi:hypothetical protein
MIVTIAALTLVTSSAQCQTTTRFPENPLISLTTSKSLGDNINGPSVIRVPEWISHPLGRYYMYFAHHRGTHIRLAYADSFHGPWKIYEPGVLNVRDTIFYQPPPDSPSDPALPYTHVASPEIYVDEPNHRLIMFVHGMWTDGKSWPSSPRAAGEWLQKNGYSQFTQTVSSQDGLHFQPSGGIAARTSYLRVFRYKGGYYSLSRLGILGTASDLAGPYELGPDLFSHSPYAGRVRHVGLLARGETLHVFFSAIGDAPEKILHTTIPLGNDWHTWQISQTAEVLAPRESYECVDLPVRPSKAGESEGRERALRDPAVFEENGKVYLFYTVCGEQGIGAADVTAFVR